MILLKVSHLVAKEKCRCDRCGGLIKKGARYVSEQWRDDGEDQTDTYHTRCPGDEMSAEDHRLAALDMLADD